MPSPGNNSYFVFCNEFLLQVSVGHPRNAGNYEIKPAFSQGRYQRIACTRADIQGYARQFGNQLSACARDHVLGHRKACAYPEMSALAIG